MREAVLADHGAAEATYEAFQNLSKYDQDCVIEFLKSLRIMPDARPEHLRLEACSRTD
jgi:hypothetical protein